MLEGVKPEEGDSCDVFGPGIDPYYATGISRMVLGGFLRLILMGRIVARDDSYASPK